MDYKDVQDKITISNKQEKGGLQKERPLIDNQKGSPKKQILKTGKIEKTLITLLIVLIIAAGTIWLLSPKTSKQDNKKLKFMEERLTYIDEQLKKLKTLEETIKTMEAQKAQVKNFLDKYDRLEASMNMKIDLLSQKIEAIQNNLKKINEIEVKNNVAKQKDIKPTKTEKIETTSNTIAKKQPEPVSPKKISTKIVTKSKTSYHIVKQGDTFYSISRKYGLSVNKLKSLNKLKSNTTIYPGQKLIISSTSK